MSRTADPGELAGRAPLSITLFGPFAVSQNGHPLPRMRTRKGYALLALLALRRGAPVDRAWLAGTLWPDSTETQGFANLRNSLKDLRRALAGNADRLYAPTPRTLSLDLVDVEVDVLAFEAAVARGDEAALAAAVALYRGPLLEGWSEEWVFQERQEREQAYLAALEVLAGHATARQEYGEAEGYLRQAVATDPLRESAQRGLMVVLARSGHSGAALAVYRELRRLLLRELNAAPDEATQALFQQIRGEARERASRPIPRLSSREDVRRHNLPRQMTRFIGREREIARIREFLGASCLLTLTGTGGCGKTRLALQVAAEVLDDYPDGVWLVELAALAEPALVAQTVASALGVREESGRPLIATLTDFLHPKTLLLLLDNCEHLLAACAQLTGALLRECPGLGVMASSRAALGVVGEQLYRVPSLSLPDTTDGSLLETSCASEAVQLFVDRARLAEPNFALTSANALAVGQVCQRLDGIPLAIELAAVRVKALSATQIADRLDDRFRLLTDGSRTALPRHQTLRALIDWSYGLLSQPERVLFHRLAVFAGGWSLVAAEVVCSDGIEGRRQEAEGSPDGIEGRRQKAEGSRDRLSGLPSAFCLLASDSLDLLTSLVDKSLVVAEARGEEVRYRLLETIRQYAWERLLEAGEATALRRRHRDWFLALAEEAEPEIWGASPAPWLDRLERENDNLRAALAWCKTEVDRHAPSAMPEGSAHDPSPSPAADSCSSAGAEVGMRLGGALRWFWYLRGYTAEGRQHLAELLATRGSAARTAARAKALYGAGLFARDQGEMEAAWSLLEESLAIRREIGDELVGETLGTMGIAALVQGNYQTARALFKENHAIHQETGNRLGIAEALNHMGWAARCQGEYAAAQAFHEEGLLIVREFGRKYSMALALQRLGTTARCQADHETAQARLEESLAIARQLGDRHGIAMSLSELAMTLQSQGDYQTARRLHEQSITIRRELGNPRGLAFSLNGLASWARGQGENEKARTLHAQSLVLFRGIGSKPGITESLEGMAAVAVVQTQPRRAAQLFGAAEGLRTDMGSPLPPVDRREHDRCVAAIRAALGEEAFAAAWAEGRAMPLEAAIALALEEENDAP